MRGSVVGAYLLRYMVTDAIDKSGVAVGPTMTCGITSPSPGRDSGSSMYGIKKDFPDPYSIGGIT